MASRQAKAGNSSRNLVAAAIARFRPTTRLSAGESAGEKAPLLESTVAREPSSPDPVSLAVFAIDRVGPAAVRACASGVEVRIAAEDEATAAVIRAALTETARRRPTDRLIRVETD